jgi:ssDNA-specific exonuclease RecJ
LRQEVNSLYGESAEELATLLNRFGFDSMQLIFALKVFEELGLVAFQDGKLTVYRGVKAELHDSAVYRKVSALQNGDNP